MSGQSAHGGVGQALKWMNLCFIEMYHVFKGRKYARTAFRLGMLWKDRTVGTVLLGALAVFLALGAVGPVLAWHATGFSTQLNPSSCGTSSGCSVPSVTDTASVTLSSSGAPSGVSITFNVYQGTCSDHSGTPLLTSNRPITSDLGLQQVTSDPFSTAGHSPGSYVWIVTYNQGDYPLTDGSPNPACEPMNLLTYHPPTVPEFPFGLALLFAVAIPGLLLLRRTAGKPLAPQF